MTCPFFQNIESSFKVRQAREENKTSCDNRLDMQIWPNSPATILTIHFLSKAYNFLNPPQLRDSVKPRTVFRWFLYTESKYQVCLENSLPTSATPILSPLVRTYLHATFFFVEKALLSCQSTDICQGSHSVASIGRATQHCSSLIERSIHLELWEARSAQSWMLFSSFSWGWLH